MLPTNPITLPSGLDPNTAAEEYIQTILQIWLEKYFSLIPFNTPDKNGNLMLFTFPACLIRMQETDLPETPDKPIIHIAFAEQETRRRDYTDNERGLDLNWTVSAIIKLPASAAQSKEKIRRIADHLAWLLNSHEKSAIQQHGIHNISLVSGPVIIPQANGWHSRSIIFTCRTRRTNPKPI